MLCSVTVTMVVEATNPDMAQAMATSLMTNNDFVKIVGVRETVEGEPDYATEQTHMGWLQVAPTPAYLASQGKE